MKIERLLNILMYLVNHPRTSAKELADHFEVSVRTIQRDIDHLTLAGVPIYAETGRTGGYQLLDSYRVDRNYLNSEESEVLRTFLSSLEQSVPDPDLQSTCNKLLAILSSGSKSDRLVIKSSPQFNELQMRQNFNVLSKARDLHVKVDVNYIDVELQETMRRIHPYSLILMGSVWYLYGFCELRSDFRMFKLSRIVACNLLEDNGFEVKSLPDKLPWETSMNTGRNSEHIVLELDRCLLGKLSDYFDHTNCVLEGDKIIATLDFPVDEWLYTLLCQLIPHVKILEPSYVRETFLKKLYKCVEENEKL